MADVFLGLTIPMGSSLDWEAGMTLLPVRATVTPAGIPEAVCSVKATSKNSA